MNTPLVSVVMPVCNVRAYVGEAITSILGQSHPRLELIVVDDGSTDGTREVISERRSRDPRIRLLALESGGVSRAWNAGVALTQGDFIARMDGDDIAPAERLSLQVEAMCRLDLDVCGGQVEVFGKERGRWWFPESGAGIRTELLFRPALMHPTVMFRARVARESPHQETAFEDYELWTRLALEGRKLGNLPDVLVHYRRYAEQTHVVRQARLRTDLQRHRFRYFYAQFPGTPLADYLPLARVSDKLPIQDRVELDRAGQWLVTLSALPDPQLKERMAKRWRETWQRSEPLLGGSDDVFRPHLRRILEGGA